MVALLQVTLYAYRYLFERGMLPRSSYGLLGNVDQPGTARDFHVHHGQALDVRLLQYLGQLLPMSLDVIQLRAPEYHCPALNEILMEPGVGEGNTVAGEEQIGTLQKWGIWWDEAEVHRPVSEHRFL